MMMKNIMKRTRNKMAAIKAEGEASEAQESTAADEARQSRSAHMGGDNDIMKEGE